MSIPVCKKQTGIFLSLPATACHVFDTARPETTKSAVTFLSALRLIEQPKQQ